MAWMTKYAIFQREAFVKNCMCARLHRMRQGELCEDARFRFSKRNNSGEAHYEVRQQRHPPYQTRGSNR
ncbi:hypothetical protein Pla52n_31840 [Stieleria varia]|uniref:Uncharacterized protein n=1 Tax=Stieleria varia TaxID=2528005 RepID=A0A5C6AQA5_9BACT|nr:hypothetical protein Pla52n_31840 [Stieleria varia]